LDPSPGFNFAALLLRQPVFLAHLLARPGLDGGGSVFIASGRFAVLRARAEQRRRGQYGQKRQKVNYSLVHKMYIDSFITDDGTVH